MARLDDLGGTTRLRLTHDGFSGLGGFVTRTMLVLGWRSLLKTELLRVLERDSDTTESISR